MTLLRLFLFSVSVILVFLVNVNSASNETSQECVSATATLSPTYGPRSAHTEVTIHIQIPSGDKTLSTCYGCNSTVPTDCESFTCSGNTMTIPPRNMDKDIISIFINVQSCNDYNISAGNFTYRPDPGHVLTVSGLFQTIITGGIKVIIDGEGLDASASSQLEVQNKVTTCTVNNSTRITCYTPDLSSLTASLTSTSAEGTIATYNASIMFGNLTIQVQEELNVYPNPDITPLTPLEPFVANQNNVLTIKGTNLLNHGFTEDDVSITIGDADWMTTGSNLCTNVNLTDTWITCEPPPMKTDLIKYESSSSENPTQPNVTVFIGLYKFSANQIQYTLEESFSIVMMVMIGILGLVVVISVVCIILTLCGCGRRPQPFAGNVTKEAPYEQLKTDSKLPSVDYETIEEKQPNKAKSKPSAKSSKGADMSFNQASKTNDGSGIQVKAFKRTSDEFYDNVVDASF